MCNNFSRLKKHLTDKIIQSIPKYLNEIIKDEKIFYKILYQYIFINFKEYKVKISLLYVWKMEYIKIIWKFLNYIIQINCIIMYL